MNTNIYLSDEIQPVGTYRDPMLDVGITNMNADVGREKLQKVQNVVFYDEKSVKELYDRYKKEITWDIFGLQDVKDIKENMIDIDDFLVTDHIYILLGCLEGKEHEVLNS